MKTHGVGQGAGTPPRLRLAGAALLSAAVLSGCHYVKRDDFDATISDIRANQTRMQGEIDANKADLAALKAELDEKFKKYDATISELQGRVRVDLAAHFDFNQAALRDQDKPALDDFARVMREHHPDYVVTVEGFTDPAGSAAFNKKLGQKRADTVRDYLVQNGSLTADKLRAVSYGKARDRQVVPGAWGDKGEANRRVALVIDYVGAGGGAGAAASPGTGEAQSQPAPPPAGS